MGRDAASVSEILGKKTPWIYSSCVCSVSVMFLWGVETQWGEGERRGGGPVEAAHANFVFSPHVLVVFSIFDYSS